MLTRRPPVALATGNLIIASGDATYVYRAYCRCGDILYIGITNNLFSRFTSHARTRAAWESKMARLEWELLPARAQAEVEEARLIQTLDPPHNIQGRSREFRQVRWAPLPWPSWPEPGTTQQERFRHRVRAVQDRMAQA